MKDSMLPYLSESLLAYRLSRWRDRLPSLILSVVLLSVLAWWAACEGRLAKAAGQVFTLGSFTVDLPLNGPPAEFGRDELLQPPGQDSAEQRHIRLEYVATPGGEPQVWLHDLAAQRRLYLDLSDGSAGDASRWAVPRTEVSTATVGRTALVFSEVSTTGFHLTIRATAQGGASQEFAFSLGAASSTLIAGHANVSEAQSLAECQPSPLDWLERRAAYVQAVWDQWRPTVHPVLSLGGRLTCLYQQRRSWWQVGAPDLRWHELLVTYDSNEHLFYLQANDPVHRNDRLIMFREQASEIAGYAGLRWRIDGTGGADPPRVTSFIAGRTRYTIAAEQIGTGPGRIARVTVMPAAGGRIPFFAAADDKCGWLLRSGQHPADRPELDAVCPAAIPAGVAVTQPFNILDRYLNGGSAMLQPTERMLRRSLLAIAVVLAAWLSGMPGAISACWREQRNIGPARALEKLFGRLMPVWLTLLAVSLSILPGLAIAAGMSPGADAAREIMLAGWALAGLAVIWCGGGILPGIFWILLTIIVAIGSIALTSLALDGTSTYWVEFIAKHRLLFLDVVPPFAVAVATAPPEAIRPVMQELVTGNSRVYRLVLWLPLLALIAMFGWWALSGDQQGVGGFQPVEAGKFAALPLIGVPLIGFARWARRLNTGTGSPRRFVLLLLLASFLAILLYVPIFRSDYSPVLIVSLTLTLLVLFHFVPDGFRMARASLRVGAERMRIPLLHRPRVHRGRERFIRVMVVLLVLLVLVLGPWAIWSRTGPLIAWALSIDPPEWSTQQDEKSAREENLARLENSLGRGSRLVPVQRFITWWDLDYSATGDAATFRDLDYQVIRSRIVVANAPCHSDTLFPTAASGWIMHGWAASVFTDIVATGETLIDPLVARSDLCAPLNDPPGGQTGDKQAAGNPRRRALTGDPTPIHIPVVQSDFIAAYLTGRHGLEAAGLLMACQVLLLLTIIRAWQQLRVEMTGESAERVVRHLLSIFLAGSGLLFALQWIISWSNMLGLLPVMGQPMTFLATGTSHHLGMALPCVLAILVAIRYGRHRPPVRQSRSPPPPRT
jgi:hypothetical protein